MNKSNFTIFYRIVAATAIFAAIMTQFNNSLSEPTEFNAINFFSFFTIQSKIIIAVVFLISVYFLIMQRSSKKLEFIRGASILFMVITGIIYFLLLRNVDVQISTPWINNVLHYIIPTVALLDWLLNPPARKIKFKHALLWLLFPFVYLLYQPIRGSLIGWYPYPFLSDNDHSYTQIALTCAVVFIGLLVLVWSLTIVTPKVTKEKTTNF